MAPMHPPAGQAATGDNFFDRPNEIRRITEALAAGSHLLIAAPRRVGKTSILLRLKDMNHDGFICLYTIVQSADSQREFFKRLYRMILEDPYLRDNISSAYKAGSMLKTVLDKFKGVKIAGTGIDFQDAAEADYYDEFLRLVKSLPDDLPRLVLMIDEFPDALMNIERAEGRDAAVKFLQTCRELRQQPQVRAKLQFVYTGSVGLENVVGRLGVPEHINDLESIEIRQLTLRDARRFIAATQKPFTLDEPAVEALIAKIGWRIPYHFVVLLNEIQVLWEDEQPPAVNAVLIDRAMDSLVKKRIYFEFWQTRLERSFDTASYAFAEALLSELSQQQNGVLERDRIVVLAGEHGVDETQRRYVVQTLIHDGYINDNDEPTQFRFNSPLLQLWWRRNIADF